jgi:hypothetical protein
MSAYEELVERCSALFYLGPHSAEDREAVRSILAEVLRTLESPTNEMLGASWPRTKGSLTRDAWDATLRASPLNPR